MRVRLLLIGVVAAATMVVSAGPVAAQELVDASGERGGGGLAFVLMTVMVFGIGAALFFMDRIRRRATDE